VAAGGSWIWQYAFPSGIRSVDAADSVIRRHQLEEEEEEEKKIVQRAFAAARDSDFQSRASLRASTI